MRPATVDRSFALRKSVIYTRTIKEPGIDTKSVPGLFFFILKFTPKRGVFSNFATHFDFRCHDVVLLPAPRIIEPLHIALLIR